MLFLVVGSVSADVTTQADLNDAIQAATAGSTVEISAAGTYKVPGISKNITVKGTVSGVVFDCVGSGSIASIPNGCTFENVKFLMGSTNYHGFQHAGAINMKNCTFEGLFFSYGDMNFNGCTFNQTASDYCMWDYGQDLTYTNCTFNCAGKFLNIYNEGNGNWKLTVEGCTFNSTKKNKSALNIKASCGAKVLGWDVTINNCKVNDEDMFPSASGDATSTLYVGSPIWQVDDRTAAALEANIVKVTLDGAVVYGGSTEIVTVEVPEEVTISGTESASEPEKTAAKEAVEELGSNTAITSNEATNVAEVEEVTTLKIEVKNVAVETTPAVGETQATATVTKVTYDVQPMKDEEKVTETTEVITFRLPVPQSFKGVSVKVSHNHNEVTSSTYETVQGEGANKYVELASDKFSEWTLEDINPNTVAVIGETQYESLQAAITAANANDEIILIADQEISTAIEISKSLTLNLNGKTIINNVASNRLFRVGGVTFTIDGTAEGSSMIIPETNKYSFGFVDMRNMSGSASTDSKLVLNGGYYEGATLCGAFFKGRNHYQTFELNNVHCKCTAGDGQQYYANGYYYNGDNASVVNSYGYLTTLKVVGGLYEHATLAISASNVFQGTNFMTDGKSSVSFDNVEVVSSHGPIYELSNGEMTINNCDFTIEGEARWDNSAICASNNATLNVNGGKYNAPYAVYALTSGATININGGEFTGSKSILVAGTDYPEAVSTINVSDGKFTYTGSNPSEAFDTYGSSPTTIVISGGTFNVEIPNEYCAEGFVPVDNGDGTYGVKEDNFVAQVGENKYETLADAIAAVPTDGTATTIKMLADVDLEAALTVANTKNITLDLNGKTVKNEASKSLAQLITVNGKLTIDDSSADKDGKIQNTASAKYVIKTGTAAAVLTLNNGTIETTTGNGNGAVYGTNGAFVMTGGKVIAAGTGVTSKNVTISGGEITATAGQALCAAGTISGGKFISTNNNAVYANQSGTLEITGGEFTGVSTKPTINIYTTDVKVTGATLNNGVGFASNATAMVLPGSDDAYLANTHAAFYDGETLVGYAPINTGLFANTKVSGKTVKLTKDVATTTYLNVTKSFTLDLNNHNITCTPAKADATILTKGTASAPVELTIKGEGKVSCGDHGEGCNAIQVSNYSTVNIEGGEFSVPGDNSTLYMLATAGNSVVNISSGEFKSGDGKYILNIKDDVRANNTFNVTGGTFHGFNPADNNAEGEHTNFVAEGYESVDNGDGTWTVKVITEDDAAITIIDNEGRKCNYKANSQIILEDGVKSVSVNNNVEVSMLRYNRTFNASAGSWQSWVVPFNTRVSNEENSPIFAKIVQFAYVDASGKIVDDANSGELVIVVDQLSSGDIVKANYPYFVKVKAPDTYTFWSSDDRLYKTTPKEITMSTSTKEFTFTGVYERIEKSNIWMMDLQGQYSHMTTLKEVNPYRWYFTINSKNVYGEDDDWTTPSNVRVLVLGEDELATSIMNAIKDMEQHGEKYDISGRMIQHNQNGLYINAGKKYLKK